jgi:hypothetical protein
VRTLCEWNPARDEIALNIGAARIGCHEPAAVSLGRHSEWYLCERCARLSVFAHFHERSMLAARFYASRQATPHALEASPPEPVHSRSRVSSRCWPSGQPSVSATSEAE